MKMYIETLITKKWSRADLYPPKRDTHVLLGHMTREYTVYMYLHKLKKGCMLVRGREGLKGVSYGRLGRLLVGGQRRRGWGLQRADKTCSAGGCVAAASLLTVCKSAG